MKIERLFTLLFTIAATVAPSWSAAASPTVQFDPPTYTVAENGGSVVVRITRSPANVNSETTVNYATANGSAVAGQDYDAVSGRLTFAAGENEKTVQIPIVNDVAQEGPENFTVFLSSPVGASLGSAATATSTIADDDSATSTIQFDSSSYSVNEGDGQVILAVNRSGALGTPASVTYSTSDGTTTAGSDYAASSGTINFAPGEVRKTIAIPIIDDTIKENSEAFSVTLGVTSSGATLGDPITAGVTIVDNDGGSGTVQFNPTTYSAKETPGNSTVTLTVTANRFGDPATTITVNYTTSDGTATAGSDYVATSGTVTFGPGETQKTFPVTILDDALIENAENFFVTLTGVTGASVGQDSTATVTISDDDSPTASIGFSASSYNVDEGAGAVTLTVTRSGGLGFFATVDYATDDDTAKADVNYVATTGQITFAPGEISKEIKVQIIDEGTADPTLQFAVTLTDPNGTGFVGGQSTAMVNIFDNDANTFRFSPGSYFVNERAGSVTLTVEVQRSGDPAQEVTVDYVTTDGTAQAGYKYSRTEGRLTFGANVSTQTITVPILDEPFIEGTTYFNVVLSNPQPTTVSKTGTAASRLGSPSTAVVNIIDDDARTFQFTSSSYSIANSSGAANVTVTFNRLGDVRTTYTVDYSTVDGSAVAGRDYTPSAGRLTFQPNETSKTIVVAVTQQPAGQPDRQFQVKLSNPSSGAVLGQPSIATVTITNPDFSTKLLNISTRGPVQMGDDVMIAGFLIEGDSAKRLVVRGIGPSLTARGVPNAITDPTVTLMDPNGTQLAFDDDYTSLATSDRQAIEQLGLTPSDSREAALLTTLAPGNYTAILRGKASGTGLVEVYDVSGTIRTKLVNISTRGKVEQGDNGAMIAGFIIGAPQNQPGVPQHVVIRAIGPSLKSYGVTDALADTTLEIYRGSNKILENDNWKAISASDQQELRSLGIAPSSDKESAIITTLDPGSYSAVIRGNNDTTGVALAEVYQLNQ